MSKSILLLSLVFYFLAGGLPEAQADPISQRPTVIVSPKSVVRGERVRLGDIARVGSKTKEFQKVVDDLKALEIVTAPPPKSQTSVTGAKILSIIEELGVGRDDIRYHIPRAVTIERAGRVVTPAEVLETLREVVSQKDTLDIQIREVNWQTSQVIPIGDTRFNVQFLGKPSGGKLPLRVVAIVDEKPAARFLATAVVDDWRSIPVLNRTLERGMLISTEDIDMVRMNLFRQPVDVAQSLKEVLGHAVKNRIQAGETIRRSLVDIPPLVPKGKSVTIVYRQGPLKATATGQALDDGLRGSTIRVRNASSRRVVQAVVKDKETVEVR